jgi:hypothetical protein
MRLFYYIKKFYRLPNPEKGLLFKCMVILPVTHIIVHLIPLKLYLSLLKINPNHDPDNINTASAAKLARKNLNRIISILPWQCTCLVKAITMKALLYSLGVKSNLIFSMAKSKHNSIRAHAYLIINNEHYFLKKRNFHDVLILN